MLDLIGPLALVVAVAAMAWAAIKVRQLQGELTYLIEMQERLNELQARGQILQLASIRGEVTAEMWAEMEIIEAELSMLLTDAIAGGLDV